MPYHYKISLQPVDEAGIASGVAPLTFTVSNHDDISEIVQKTRALGVVPEDEATELAVGLKLFSEVLIRHRKLPPFDGLWPPFGDFMKRLKSHRPS